MKLLRAIPVFVAMVAGVQTSPEPTAGVAETPAPVALGTVFGQEHIADLLTREEVLWEPPWELTPGGPQTKEALPVLQQAALADDPGLRIQALEGLAHTDPVGRLEDFLLALADPSPDVRDTAVHILLDMDRNLFFDKVMAIFFGAPDALTHADVPTVVAALDAALPLLRPALEPRMLQVLESSDETSIRKAVAAHALGRMGSTSAVPELTVWAWSDDFQVASWSANALGMIADPQAIPRLEELAFHPRPEIRWNAVQGLGRNTTDAAVGALGRIVLGLPADEDDLRRYALQLLAASKSEASIPYLIDVLRGYPALVRYVTDALHRLTGEDFGDAPQQWVEWFEKKVRAASQPPAPVLTPHGEMPGPRGPN